MMPTTPFDPQNRNDRNRLKKTILIRFGVIIVLSCLMLFLPAGTWWYWQAWGYMATLFIPATVLMIYLFQHDPQLLERRMRTREKEAKQKRIMKISLVIFLIAFLLPGLDHRFQWSSVPILLTVVADFLVLLGYLLFARTLHENRYASRVIEVEQDQQVVSTGPYAIVRHPMYVANLLIFIFSPLALGSYWAMIPMLLLIGVVLARIKNEEEVLRKELRGYREYTQKTKYRLIPGVW